MAPIILQTCRIFLVSILAVLNTIMLKKKPPMSNQPKKSAAPVMKENNRVLEVDMATIRNMVAVMDTALMVDTDILMEVTVGINSEDMVVTEVTSLEATEVTKPEVVMAI